MENRETTNSILKLTFDTTRFFVNKEKGTVACKITSIVRPTVMLSGLSTYMSMDSSGRCRENVFETVGIVHLHDGDTWNEELGKRLAESKAKRQAYQRAYKYIKEVTEDAVKEFAAVIDFAERMNNLIEHEKEHFNDLIDEA